MAVNICLRFLVASIKLVFFILLLCDGFHAADFQNTMFNICDKNADNKLSKSELRECLGASAAERISTRVDPTTIMNLMDLDKDGEISLPEYMKIVSNVQGGKSDPIEVVDRDGNKKTYTSEELFQKMSDSPEDLKMDGDKLVKENEGTTNLNELAKDHPMVSNVVTLGQWSLAKLIEQGIVKNGTTILNLRTLSVEEIAAESAGNRKGLLSPQQIYKAHLELALGSGKKKSKWQSRRYYEVEVVRDKEMYLRPHLNIENVWRLDDDREREEHLAPFVTGEKRWFGPPVKRFLEKVAANPIMRWILSLRRWVLSLLAVEDVEL